MKCKVCNEYIDLEHGTCAFCGFVLPEPERQDLTFIRDLKQNIERLNTRLDRFEKDVEDRASVWAEWKGEELVAPPLTESLSAAKSDDGRIMPEPESPGLQAPAPGMVKKPVAQTVSAVKEASRRAMRKQKEIGEDSFEVRLGQKWLLVIGILTMILGVGYFLKYSIEQGWIGPAGRVALAYAWGVALMGAGEYFRRRKYERFGYSLSAAGAATLYFGTFAAYHLYGLFPMALSYVLMAGVTLTLCLLSISFSAFWLAVMGMLGGFGTPFMLGLGEGQAFILGYVTLLNLGFLFISCRRRWPSLEVLGLAFTYVLFGWWLTEHYRTFEFIPVVGFSALFAALYHAVPFATAYLGRGRQGSSLHAPMLVVLNTVFSLGVCAVVFDRHVDNSAWMGLPIMLHALSLAVMAVYLKFKRPEEEGALATLFAGSSLLAAVAMPVMLTGYWMTLGWVLLALVLQQAGFGFGRRELLGGAYVLLTLAAARFVLHDYSDIFRLDMNRMIFLLGYPAHMLTRWAASAGVLVPLFIVAFSASYRSGEKPHFLSSDRNDHALLYGLFTIALFIVFNVETAAFCSEYIVAARFAALSVLWTLFSVGLMLIGFRNNNTAARRAALTLFSITLWKVFFVDMAHVNTPWRILSFIVLGTVLMGTSYLYYRFRDRLIEAMGRGRIDNAEAKA